MPTKSKLRLQTVPGYHRHVQAHGFLILPLVHQKGTMHTLHLRLSPSQEILLLLTQAKECNLLRLLPSTLHSRANFSYQVAALNNSWRCSRASILIWKSDRRMLSSRPNHPTTSTPSRYLQFISPHCFCPPFCQSPSNLLLGEVG